MTDATGVITRVNPAFEKLTGYTSVGVVGKDLSQITIGGPQCEAYQQIWREVFQEKIFEGTLMLRTRSGAGCRVQVSIAALRTTRGKVTSLVGSGREIAEAKEQHLAEAALAPAHDSFGRAIHDLNNVLMVISSQAELACESLDAEHPARRAMEAMKSSSRRAIEVAKRLSVSAHRQQPDAAQAMQGTGLSGRKRAHELPAGKPAAKVLSPSRLGTLLLVEDESLVRESISEFLAQAGYEVLAAATAQEAFAQLKLHTAPIQLVITDLILPGMHGRQLAALVPEFHPEAKVLFISGHAPSEELFRAGVEPERFLAKPFSLPILANKVREVLSQPLARAAGAAD